MSTETTKKRSGNTGRIITAIVGAALVAALAFFIFKYYNEKSRNEVQAENMDGLTAEIEDLETDLEGYKLDLENKDLDLEEKERLLAEKEQELVDKQKRIDQLVSQNKISAAAAERLRGKVKQLEYYIREYQEEIETLKTQLADERAITKGLTHKIDTMTGEIQKITMEKEETRIKLENAAMLDAHTFEFYRIRNSGKEVKDTDFRRGQMDDFKLCFRVNQNLAAKPGQRDFYIQMIDTKGQIIKNSNGSGYFKYLDEDQAFTIKESKQYDNNTMQVCGRFKKPDNYDFVKGKHKILVFCDGYEIGDGSFVVK